MFLWSYCYVVADDKSAVIVFGQNLAAVAGPEDIPIVAVWRVLRGRERDVGEGTDASREVGHLQREANIPVDIIFHDECGGELPLYNTIPEVSMAEDMPTMFMSHLEIASMCVRQEPKAPPCSVIPW
jgi:hypothetical protein